MAESNVRTSYDMHDVLQALRDNVSRNISVATLATVVSVSSDGDYPKCTVKPFPLTEGESRTAANSVAINGVGNAVQPGDIVAVLYMDRDPRQGLKKALSGLAPGTVSEESVHTMDDLHEKAYGLIIMDLTLNWKEEGGTQ